LTLKYFVFNPVFLVPYKHSLRSGVILGTTYVIRVLVKVSKKYATINLVVRIFLAAYFWEIWKRSWILCYVFISLKINGLMYLKTKWKNGTVLKSIYVFSAYANDILLQTCAFILLRSKVL